MKRKLLEDMRELLHEGTNEAIANASGKVRATQDPLATDQFIGHLRQCAEVARGRGKKAHGKVLVHYVEYDPSGRVVACTLCHGAGEFRIGAESAMEDKIFIPCPLCQTAHADSFFYRQNWLRENERHDLGSVFSLKSHHHDCRGFRHGSQHRCPSCGDWVHNSVSMDVCKVCQKANTICKTCEDTGEVACKACRGLCRGGRMSCRSCDNTGVMGCPTCEEYGATVRTQ